MNITIVGIVIVLAWLVVNLKYIGVSREDVSGWLYSRLFDSLLTKRAADGGCRRRLFNWLYPIDRPRR